MKSCKAFKAGGSCYNAPAQNVASFLKYLQPDLRCNIKATYRPGLTACALDSVLPDFVADTLRSGILAFEKKFKVLRMAALCLQVSKQGLLRR